MKIVLLTRSMEVGGTERQLVELAIAMQQRGHAVSVLTFYANGQLKKMLEVASVPVISLNKKGRWDVAGFLWRMGCELRRLRPEVVYSFLAVPNILAVLMRPFLPGCKWVWGIRAALLDLSPYDRLTRWTYALEARLSRHADLIICNSHAGMKHAAARGFPRNKLCVIANGIDTQRFQPDVQARAQLRAAWGIGEQEILIGIVARLDPVKDHSTFLQAAAQVQAQCTSARFVVIGDGPENYTGELRHLASELGLDERLIWAGARQDMVAVYNAMDILALTSTAEGFPNVLAEAMACGVPCVCTDAGDSAEIVESRGWCVPAGDVAAIEQALLARVAQMGSVDRQALRVRIEQQFSIKRLLQSTEQALITVEEVK